MAHITRQDDRTGLYGCGLVSRSRPADKQKVKNGPIKVYEAIALVMLEIGAGINRTARTNSRATSFAALTTCTRL